MATQVEERFWAKVDKSGDCWLWTAATVEGYGVLWVGGKLVGTHVLSYTWYVRDIPKGFKVDHMCHTRSCVRPVHLRTVTQKQNQENRAGLNSNNKSGLRGVSWAKDRNKWMAYITHQRRKINLGYFEDKEEAGRVVQEAREKLFTPNPMSP